MEDCDQRDLNTFSCSCDARQHPVHFPGVRELKNHFIDYLIITNSSRNRDDLRIRWHLWNESTELEITQLLAADAASQHRNVVDIGVLNHCCEGLLGGPSCKLIAHVLLPQVLKEGLVSCEAAIGLSMLFIVHEVLPSSFWSRLLEDKWYQSPRVGLVFEVLRAHGSHEHLLFC